MNLAIHEAQRAVFPQPRPEAWVWMGWNIGGL
jgi:hypothetical protein